MARAYTGTPASHSEAAPFRAVARPRAGPRRPVPLSSVSHHRTTTRLPEIHPQHPVFGQINAHAAKMDSVASLEDMDAIDSVDLMVCAPNFTDLHLEVAKGRKKFEAELQKHHSLMVNHDEEMAGNGCDRKGGAMPTLPRSPRSSSASRAALATYYPVAGRFATEQLLVVQPRLLLLRVADGGGGACARGLDGGGGWAVRQGEEVGTSTRGRWVDALSRPNSRSPPVRLQKWATFWVLRCGHTKERSAGGMVWVARAALRLTTC
ncbi:hypothetical protein EJB05_49389, partial [Eragrostis curvula]